MVLLYWLLAGTGTGIITVHEVSLSKAQELQAPEGTKVARVDCPGDTNGLCLNSECVQRTRMTTRMM